MRQSRPTRLIGWQGFTVDVLPNWELTGFSGHDESGYFRVDDGEEQGLEVKWAIEPRRAKTAPDLNVRRNQYFNLLRQTARKKKIELETRETDAPRALQAADRETVGFSWVGDRKAIGGVWYCRTCRRVVIAQVIGAPSGRGALAGNANRVLETLRCHDQEPEWRVWSLYDLEVAVPSRWKLESPEVMNVYLRLPFAQMASRLTIEQWSLANVARRDAYLDLWLAANSHGEMSAAKYTVEESAMHNHPGLRLAGRASGQTVMTRTGRHLSRLQWPPTRYSALAWECEPSNKVYLVQSLRTRAVSDDVQNVSERLRCHTGEISDHTEEES